MLKMFNKSDTPTNPPKLPSPADVARGVRMKAEHQMAENTSAELKAQISSIVDDMRNLAAAGENRVNDFDGRMNALVKREREARAAMNAVHRDLLTLRAERAERVTAALSSRRTAACDKMYAALLAINEALIEMDAIHYEIFTAGGEADLVPTLGCATPITNLALRFKSKS